ncbi:MAG: 4-hydroxy-3-methylbut-2-enyl diphosphate reductase [Lachnospiraceae bacterium]|nr:4-hydroxy-3-methylbut-2-enyl diphosphate reductase [Lachnospiraceae bacterium]
MEVKTAKTAGFCFGVKRAVDQVYKQIETGGNIYTLGPIIHNDQVVKDLEEKGIRVINSMEELEQQEKGTLIIRSHGVEKEVYEQIEKMGFSLVDATCPFVKKIHKIVEEESKKGRHIVIIGSSHHPEVEGIIGWAEGSATVIATKEEMENFTLKEGEKACIVSQTTFNYNKFQELVEIFEKKGYDGIVVNTICNATEERQTQAREIARGVDVMIVIGGTHSSNTRKLYEICREECENTYFIQTLSDLKREQIGPAGSVGITAGASTPNNIIEEVQNYVRINF